MEALQQHRPPLADPPSPDSTDPNILVLFNVTYTKLRLLIFIMTLPAKPDGDPVHNIHPTGSQATEYAENRKRITNL
jgi:hypothetical protein